MREVDDNEEWRHRRMTSTDAILAYFIVGASYKAKQLATVLQLVTLYILIRLHTNLAEIKVISL